MGGLSRRKKESRAYSLVLVSGGSAVAAVVFFVLAVFTAFSFFWVFVAAIIAAVAGYMAKNTVGA
jgi:hypothetical protein